MTKKFLFLIAATICISLQGFSQFSTNTVTNAAETKVAGTSTGQKAKDLLGKLKSAANLTPDQEKKILPTLEEYFNKLENIKKNSATNPTQAKQQAGQAKESMLDKVKAFVSSDQFAKIKTALAGEIEKKL